ncbi:rifin [Plasmodium falciparum RAJ116]|uniref:Rifin n=1 Tax=Plasmodium falciparum RAJ116 TaxID=580058 RepID=A0A0L0CYC5_PLAFA|nr:rifin [Plasmodium falciparum RAJ116]
MKLHYTKILLFFFPLNILLTSYHAHNKNKPSITPNHTRTTTSRLLSEYDTESSIYDNDEEMKSVKEIFERQTSQRFEEYQERMKEKQQKHKEQRDKNIQKIIHKDKMEKNLAEKIEKGCLMCGCGLGSVAGSVGLFGGIAINIWKPTALDAAIEAAIAKSAAKITAVAEAARILAGKEAVIAELQGFGVFNLDNQSLVSYFTTISYNNASIITQAVNKQYLQTCAYVPSLNKYLPFTDPKSNITICRSVLKQTEAVSQSRKYISHIDGIRTAVQNIVTKADGSANAAAEIAEVAEKATIKVAQEKAMEAATTSYYTPIIASIVAIVVIVLIMLIIYLILRYRRKKKMKKKAQYTKLLNE